jgi:hypothetical protein
MPNPQTGFGSPEQVHIEDEWYDGPRNGIADIGGRPHRFVSQWGESEDEYLGTYLLWPVAPDELVLGREQWLLFVVWNDEYEAGRVGCVPILDSEPCLRCGKPIATEYRVSSRTVMFL